MTAGERVAKRAAARAPGRPRSEATRAAILETAIRLLDREDYREISIDRIALDAKAGKQSIYRWWPSKAELMLEAFTQRALTRLPPHLPSGDAFADLEDDLRAYFALLRQGLVGKGVRSLIAEAQLDAEFRARLYAAVWKVRCEGVHALLRHGQALGQIRADLDLTLTAHLIHGAAWYRLLSGSSMPLDDQYARDVVALLRPSLSAPRRAKAPRASKSDTH